MRRVLLCLAALAIAAAGEVRVCCTVPDLGDLVRRIGGDQVRVTTFVRGGEDPHHLDARPSFIAALARADLLVEVGCELEVGWLPAVVDQARNPRLRPGSPGRLTAANHVRLLGIPDRPIDRSAGDVHAAGNPHFLTDPVRGLQVARAIAVRLGELVGTPDPFLARTDALEREVLAKLCGDTLAAGDRAALIARLAAGEVPADAGGWLARLAPLRGAVLVADHDLWPYLGERYGLRISLFLEAKPGVPPTQAHLASVISAATAAPARAIITVPYFDPRHATFVATATGLPVLRLPHQVGATDAATDWPAMLAVQTDVLGGLVR
jgi:zinc/manganese transport system substrate-binding protein